MSTNLRIAARREMRAHFYNDISATLTELVENATISLDHEEWLDDSDHWIWDLALDEYERMNGPIL